MRTARHGEAVAISAAPDAGELVLGVDPGLQRTGYALLAPAPAPREVRLVEAGVIRLARGRSLTERLVELEHSLEALLATHAPAALACEQLYAHYKHPRTAILMAHARGVILALAARNGLAIHSIAATNVKKLITGSGRASKRQIQLAVTALLNLPVVPEPNDVADAIAIGVCGVRLRRMEGATGVAARRVQA